MPIERIDAHHHWWDLSLKKNAWLLAKDSTGFLGDLAAIATSYQYDQYQVDTQALFSQSVHVQAGWDALDALGESRWLSQLQHKNPSLLAIVAFADLSQEDCQEALAAQAAIPLVTAIRQIVAWHQDPLLNCCSANHLENPQWCKQFALLKHYQLAFDLQIYPEQTAAAYRLAKANPDIKIVIEHGLQPLQADKVYLQYWRAQLKKLAQLPNVFIKLSGFAMFHRNLDETLLRTLLWSIIDIFSPRRCMVGSNFPVDLLFIKPDTLLTWYEQLLSELSMTEQTDVWAETTRAFYGGK